MARRIPGENSPQQVGELIAQEYALLYEVPVESVREAGVLRAEAGALRDSRVEPPDWGRIARLLDDSYRKLSAAVQPAATGSAVTLMRRAGPV